MLRSRRWATFILTAFVGTLSSPIVAAEPAAPSHVPRLAWSAPAECPGPRQVRHWIEARLETDFDTPRRRPSYVLAEIRPLASGGWTLRVRVNDVDERELTEREDCESLARAAVIIIAIALDPNPVVPPPEPRADELPAPDEAPEPDESWIAAEEASGIPGSDSTSTTSSSDRDSRPAIPDAARPRGSRIRATTRHARIRRPAGSRRSPRKRRARKTAPPARLELGIEANSGFETGSFPGISYFGSAGLRLFAADARMSVVATYLDSRDFQLSSPSRARAGWVDFRQWTVLTSVGLGLRSRKFEFSGQLGLAAGQLRLQTIDIDEPRNLIHPWLAVHATPEIAVRLFELVSLVIRVDAIVPLLRVPFALADQPVFHEVRPVTFAGQLGLRLNLGLSRRTRAQAG